MTQLRENIFVEANMWLCMRERGKLVPGSIRDGHNAFTVTGKNWLSKLVAWSTVGPTDIPFTNRRVRWIGVGSGSQLEAPTVSSLVTPVLATATDYLRPIQMSEYPTSTSVRFTREFGTSEITIAQVPVMITEAGLYADVQPANGGGSEDSSYDPINLPSATILDPTKGTNALIAYKAFDGLSKTVDFTLELRWELRFG